MPRRTKRASRRSVLISRTVLCSISGISEHQLRIYEREEFLAPAVSTGSFRSDEPLYDATAVRRIRLIRSLADDLEVNIPGIGVILHLLDRSRR